MGSALQSKAIVWLAEACPVRRAVIDQLNGVLSDSDSYFLSLAMNQYSFSLAPGNFLILDTLFFR